VLWLHPGSGCVNFSIEIDFLTFLHALLSDSNNDDVFDDQPQRHGGAGVPVRAQSVHHRFPSGQERPQTHHDCHLPESARPTGHGHHPDCQQQKSSPGSIFDLKIYFTTKINFKTHLHK
jgi:hypothetical protein